MSIDISEAKSQLNGNAGCIKILEGMADEKKVEEELRNLIENRWDWQVKKLSRDEYMVVFPNK